MLEASTFAGAVRAVLDELRAEPCPPMRLNQATGRIDQLGRRLHGVAWRRDQKLGECLTAAVAELIKAPALREVGRAESVRRAIQHLEAALTHADEGLRAEQEDPTTEAFKEER